MKYKKYEAVWFAVFIVLLAATICMPTLFGVHTVQRAVIGFVSVLAIFAVIRILDRKSWSGIVSVHYLTCDLLAFFNEIQVLVNSKFVFKNTKLKLQFLIVDALLDSGKFEQAFAVLNAIDAKRPQRRFSYLYYSAKYHIYMEDRNAAETELILLKMEAEKYKRFKKKYNDMMETYTDLQNKLMFIKNEYGNCAEYFRKIYESSFKTPYEKVFSAYYLGVVSMDKNEAERAKEYFTYTVEKGNKLFIVWKAKDYLDQLNAAVC